MTYHYTEADHHTTNTINNKLEQAQTFSSHPSKTLTTYYLTIYTLPLDIAKDIVSPL